MELLEKLVNIKYMEKNDILYEDRIGKLKKDTFYRQRFDACPHFMSFIGEAHTSVTNHSDYPYGQDSAYAKFENDRTDWYHSNLQLNNTAENLLNLLKENTDFIDDIRLKTEDSAKIFYENCSKVDKNILSKMSDEEVSREYKKLSDSYLEKLFVSSLIDGFSLVTDELIKNKIQELLGDKKEETNILFEKLTAHTFISFLQEEELNLLKIKQKQNSGEDISKDLEVHQKEYFWIQNNYVDDNILGIEDFRKKLEEFNDISVEDRINELRELSENHKKEKEEIFDKYKVSEELKNIIKLTDVFNYLQDERKKSTFWATHYFSIFLDDLSDRVNYSKDNLRYSVPSEYNSIIDKKIDEKDLETRRIDGCVVLWYKDDFQVITNKEQIKMLDSLTDIDVGGVQEVSGFVASKGKTVGSVKIVESVKDINKVEDGDVIVSVMTRPDYLYAMKKAVAFVTDEGGVTCHAAIVAREMKKPCVIGTKIATKVFKDGDLVEVDANNGIVRKIS
jgi:phosphohistidine swiveling domain-containing protein